MTHKYGRFEGDGRKMALPPVIGALPGTKPMKMTLATARMMIDRFVIAGESNHSPQGSTLWVILTWCAEQEQPFTLQAYPQQGYRVIKGVPLK